MEYKRQKNIRSKLISYTDQQIKLHKNKNVNILINSLSSKEIEKKNMLFTEFIIIEKPQIFQNIDNNRSIIENIYINNNSLISNIVIYPLSSRIISSNIKINMENICNFNLNNTYIEDNSNNNNEYIYRKRTNKINSCKPINIFSPIEQPCLIKKEVGERKLKMSKNEINFHVYNSLCKDKLETEKEINENNINDFGRCKNFSKQLSTDTIATDISRIIRICHYDKSLNSPTLSRSNSFFEETEEIKKAKKYAKKLKDYCLTLKKKYPNKQSNFKFKKTKNESNEINSKDIKIKFNDNKDKIIFEHIDDKMNYRKIKSRKIIIKDKIRNFIKKYSERLKDKNKDTSDDNIINFVKPNKKMKSERNIKNKIKKNSFVFSEDTYNNNTEHSTNVQYIQQEKDSKNKSNQIIAKVKRKNKKLTDKMESKFKLKDLELNCKSPLKSRKKEQILFIKKIKHKIADNNRIQKNKIKKSKRHDSPLLNSNKKEKRKSIELKMPEVGNTLGKIFFSTRNLSTKEEISVIKSNNKKNEINNKVNNNENEHVNSNNKRKKSKKNRLTLQKIRENKINFKKDEEIHKKKTLFVKKNKRNTLNISKDIIIKKRKLSYLDDNEEKLTTITNDVTKIKKKEKKIIFKLDDDSTINKDERSSIDISNDFNVVDEYLYKKKQKRIKNIQK